MGAAPVAKVSVEEYLAARVHRKRGQFALAKEYITRALQEEPNHQPSLELLDQIERLDR